MNRVDRNKKNAVPGCTRRRQLKPQNLPQAKKKERLVGLGLDPVVRGLGPRQEGAQLLHPRCLHGDQTRTCVAETSGYSAVTSPL